MNGYKVDPKAYKNYDHTKNIYDTSVDFNYNNEIIQISFNTKPDTVSKEAFKKAHAPIDTDDESKPDSNGVTMIPYNTNDGSYKAFFDINDNCSID
ncbi:MULTISPECIES: immunodominant staphylococcal antigen IsaB family protein [Staphylococcus]|uniref:immunodominant staphylococcal antigen IsaB family protein n=1 Tax=Staphylococcus TaxID=1279 RepID=UPI003D0606F9